MVVPSFRSQISRHLHFSTPCPKYDTGTVEQAAAIFQMTGSNSLLVAGRNRNAYLLFSECIVPTLPTQDWYMTDPVRKFEHCYFAGIGKLFAYSVPIARTIFRCNGHDL